MRSTSTAPCRTAICSAGQPSCKESATNSVLPQFRLEGRDPESTGVAAFCCPRWYALRQPLGVLESFLSACATGGDDGYDSVRRRGKAQVQGQRGLRSVE